MPYNEQMFEKLYGGSKMIGLLKTIQLVLLVVIFAALLGFSKRTGVIWPVLIEVAYLISCALYYKWKYGVLKSEEWMDEH